MTFKINNYFNGRIKLVTLSKYNDRRGFFSEIYNQYNLKKILIKEKYVQDNYSFNIKKGTIRGLHFQKKPFDQAKLVWVVNGEIFDVVLDIDKKSPTYGKYKSFYLSCKTPKLLYIPPSFAHGFCTLSNAASIFYKVSKIYSKKNEMTIKWNDPFLSIKWPNTNSKYIISRKDNSGRSFLNI